MFHGVLLGRAVHRVTQGKQLMTIVGPGQLSTMLCTCPSPCFRVAAVWSAARLEGCLNDGLADCEHVES